MYKVANIAATSIVAALLLATTAMFAMASGENDKGAVTSPITGQWSKTVTVSETPLSADFSR